MSTEDSTPVTRRPDGHTVIDLDRYVPGLLNWVANKLNAGASATYLSRFGIGMIEWRIVVMLACEPWITGSRICEVVGLDKAAVSRGFSRMDQAELLLWRGAGRSRLAALSAKGRTLHDLVMPVALERQRRLLHGLTEAEVDALVASLHHMLGNLPLVNATEPK